MTALTRQHCETELGLEIQCSRCREFWPADRDFFYFGPDGSPHSWCKACYRGDPKVVAKVERWKQKQRGNRPPREPEPPLLDFGPLQQALQEGMTP